MLPARHDDDDDDDILNACIRVFSSFSFCCRQFDVVHVH